MGQDDLYLLSQADRDAIVGMLQKQMREILGVTDLTNDPKPHLKDPEMSPEVYIARPYSASPGVQAGIPAMDEATLEPGRAVCEIFRITDKRDPGAPPKLPVETKKVLSAVKLPPDGLSKKQTVYNISLDPVPQQFVIVRRDKFGRWLVDSPSLSQGGTVQNADQVLELFCDLGGGGNPGYTLFPFDDILASTGGSRFFLNPDGTVTLTGDATLKMCYKIYCTNIGATGHNTDDAFEASLGYVRAGAAIEPIPASYCIGILDDTDNICEDMDPTVPGTEKSQFEATAACPFFYFNALDGDIFSIRVNRLAGSNTLTFPSIETSNGSSFWSFEIGG